MWRVVPRPPRGAKKYRSVLRPGLLPVLSALLALCIHAWCPPAAAHEDDETQMAADANPDAPAASFTVAPLPPRAGQPATFTATATPHGDASIIWYHWHFGDSLWNNGEEVMHTYATFGQPMEVALKVVDSYGRRTVIYQTLEVVDSTETGPIGGTARQLPPVRARLKLRISAITGRFKVVND